MVLTKFIEHADVLYEMLRDSADKVFLMTGNKSKKEQRQLREEMDAVSEEETMVLIATGQLVEENCEHYAVIDNEIVWYGSMNLLSKDDVSDNIMRVADKKIAQELLEMTFGKGSELKEYRLPIE